MSLASILLINLAVLLLLAFVVWLVSLQLHDSSIVDPCWGMGFAVVAGVSLAAAGGQSARGWLVLVLAIAWGLRLSVYLAWRNFGAGEDHRYQAMREHWGKRFAWVSLFTVFWLQAVILWIVSLPLQASAVSDHGLNWIDIAGVSLWTIGLGFETIGDFQLARFKADPNNRGKVLDRGLWRYTRHPNYFGDFLVWWGLYIVAAAGGAWWTVVSPLLMSVLLMKVSGVTLLEKTIQHRRPAYTEYIRRTSAFFPWPPTDG